MKFGDLAHQFISFQTASGKHRRSFYHLDTWCRLLGDREPQSISSEAIEALAVELCEQRNWRPQTYTHCINTLSESVPKLVGN